ncbi:hypothetical protein HY374_00360 [Candidatus Berkelbacteria bacterium]|nr:hypothetical protein [Candidatus Berkelbacteria bacterium]
MADAPAPAPKASGSSNDVEQNKIWAVIGYLGILFLIPLLAKKDSPYAQYHAKQGMVLFLVGFIASFVIWVPLIGWALGIGLFVLWLMGIINALGGKMSPVPLIGQFAEKLNI